MFALRLRNVVAMNSVNIGIANQLPPRDATAP